MPCSIPATTGLIYKFIVFPKNCCFHVWANQVWTEGDWQERDYIDLKWIQVTRREKKDADFVGRLFCQGN